jgi:CxxC motif-containing protein (DUF1111 family)
VSRWLLMLLLSGGTLGCGGDPVETGDSAVAADPGLHGAIAEGVRGPLGSPWSFATDDQLATFARGLALADRRMQFEDGLGPAFNVTFCGSCHERPQPGGAAGTYRNFFLTGVLTADGAFFPGTSDGASGGVVRLYSRPGVEGAPAHPARDPDVNVIAQRNPIAFFGAGLLAELDGDVILAAADPDDADGDGISGRPNFDRGFVGRFGRKAQTVSIEGFIRGPLKNHMGITTDPLSDTQKAALPVDSSSLAGDQGARQVVRALLPYGQAAATDAPTTDDDGVADPELSTDELFDLVSFAMLLAAPPVRTDLTETEALGCQLFDASGCADCHRPRLTGPRGPLPVYSDLLLHDMGAGLADGLIQGEASGAEFRTQPLWGLTAEGPFLHDGRAATLDAAILWHGGEGRAAAEAYAALDADQRAALVAFLGTLGGEDQESLGLLPPNPVVPAVGEYGGPVPGLDASAAASFADGRLLFDREFGFDEGVGAPRFNGDSCRACHFEPVLGGAGPRGVNVVRHGIVNESGSFVEPAVGTILHRGTALAGSLNLPQPDVDVFELRQTPPLFGLGLVDALDDAVILAGADPDDADGDGISGRASWVDGGRLGRFGWKAQVPTLAEFSRDAFSTELGLTVPYEDGRSFGRLQDDDAFADPEIDAASVLAIAEFMRDLGPPPRQAIGDEVEAGGLVFSDLGCSGCHTPSLEGPDGPVPLYSDLLLHEILADGTPGIEEAGASMTEFRTAPLWGLATSGPYLHDGRADTLTEAIAGHAGEADAAVARWEAGTDEDRAALASFLESL